MDRTASEISERHSEKIVKSKCLLCFNYITPQCQSQSVSDELVHKMCRQYLHSGIYEGSPRNPSADESDQQPPPDILFCPECIQSTSELAVLQENLDLLQKKMTELAFMFSLGILHRRGKSNNEEEHESNFVSVKKLVPFDVSALPNCSTWDDCEENIQFISEIVIEPQLLGNNSFNDTQNISKSMQVIPLKDSSTLEENLSLNVETNPLWMFENENSDPPYEGNVIEETCTYSLLSNEEDVNMSVKLENAETDMEIFQNSEADLATQLDEDNQEVKYDPVNTELEGKIVDQRQTKQQPPKKQVPLVRNPAHTKNAIGKPKHSASKLQCYVCEEYFHPASLRRHIEVMHDKIKPFECPVCKKKFRQNYDMATHHRKVHKKSLERGKVQDKG